MTSLMKVEIRRILSRRLLWVLTALVLVGIAIAGTSAFFSSNRDPAGVAAYEAEYDAALRSCIDSFDGGSAPGSSGSTSEARAHCADEIWVDSDPRFHYEEMKWILGTLAIPMSLLAWLLGATAIGAEWSNRTMTSLLTWESRRGSVLVSKFVAVILISSLWVFSLGVLLSLALLPAGSLRGTMNGVDQAWVSDYSLQLARVAGLGALAAAFGAALAMIGRNTAAAFGAGFAYLSAGEGIIRGFKPAWSDWLIGDNTVMFLVGPEEIDHLAKSQVEAGLLLLAYALTLIAIAWWFFRRREIA